MTFTLSLTRVSKKFPQHNVDALREVSLEIAGGQFVALMGPSGCGKSTLLNLLAGLDKPSSGEILINSPAGGQYRLQSLTEAELTQYRRLQVGFVFQFFNLLPTLTVLENVMLPLQLQNKRHPKADPKKSARALLCELGLSNRVDFYPAQLSGGQLQRVAIARALIHDPPLILADEPTGNLDSVSGEAVLTLLKTLCKERGVTLVMATHSQEAAQQADRIIYLHDGHIVSR
ncbi:MAG: ABC transporter ATP-binding protein [Vampirovibrionales bacterium]|nr:ABC transporter ATP-binding protein [Vampirovibrionales bacterium]